LLALVRAKARITKDESFRIQRFHARGGGLSRNQDIPKKPHFAPSKKRRLFRLLIGSGMLVKSVKL
jgi:hypothetical protein